MVICQTIKNLSYLILPPLIPATPPLYPLLRLISTPATPPLIPATPPFYPLLRLISTSATPYLIPATPSLIPRHTSSLPPPHLLSGRVLEAAIFTVGAKLQEQ